MIPLGTDRPLKRPTLVTYALIAANIAVFLLIESIRAADPIRAEAIVDGAVLHPFGAGFHWWNLVTYAFLHAGWRHLLGNMVFLYVFGANIEDRFRRVGFLLFYLLGAVVSGVVHIFYIKTGVLGASGAIAACTGAYFVLFPRTHIKVLWLIIYIRIFEVPAWAFIALAVIWDLWQGGSMEPVAHLAHLTGYAYGMLVSLVLLWLKILPRELFDLFSIGKQAIRRRQFKEAGLQAQERMRQHWQRAKASSQDTKLQESEALAAARAEIIRLVAAGDLPAAGAAYKRLADEYANFIGSTILSRRYQYDLANHFYQTRDHDAAVYAYQRFLEAYPKDAEAPNIRLLLGLIHARALNDPVKAKSLITEAMKDLDEEHARLAKTELESLG